MMRSSLLGRLRTLLLLWLLSSGEAFSMHSNFASAAKTSAAKARGGRNKQAAGGSNEAAVAGAESTAAGICKAGSEGACTLKALLYRGGHAGGKGQEIPLNMMKVMLQIALTTINVACWLLPLKMRRFVESKVAVGMANAFSGGVFLSLAFGHMIPHAQHGFEKTNLPATTPYFLTLGGYMLIFFVEKIAFDTSEFLDAAGDDSDDGKIVIPESNSGGTVGTAGGAGGGGGGGANSTSGRSATILLLALSVHSLFETMALGLADNSLDAGLLAMSIGLHQPAESLALLVSFLKSGLSQRQVIKMLSIFSCVGPLGIALGMFINQFASELVDSILVAMAAGTFIYVGATEVIAEEFEHQKHKWKKFFALLGGIVIIAYITSWAEALEGMAA